ncbi:MAG: nucleoside triphosphate pyrophosphohydrolase [Clostridiales bacterium]|nr:nucleoside triphosphate pyrophosphohydrolase [Clostridiales bacterium]
MGQITVVTLGPGPRDMLTLGAVEALKRARKIILRTDRCDAADYLREIGLSFDTLDGLHEESGDFDELIRRSAGEVLRQAAEGDVCYAVFDAARDETVKALRQEAASAVVLPGVPLSAPCLAAAPAQDAVEIQTASSLRVTGTQNPLLILECDSRILMGQCKLQLLSWYDPDQPVLFFPPESGAARRYEPLPLCEIDRQRKYDHTCAVLIPALPLQERRRFDFYDLVRVMAILRGEDGCPWDREQTHESLRQYLIEEAYETVSAIDEGDWEHVAEELGDVLLQVVFHARVGEDTGTFDLADITSGICRKMIDRHRHIFGGDHCDTPEEVSANWEKIKRQERGFTTQGQVLQGVAKGLPALMRAGKVQKKARDAGIGPGDPREALRQVREKAEAVLPALERGGEGLAEVWGDLLFACVQGARLCGVDSEEALRAATETFISRFCAMENEVLQDGKRLEGLTLSEMDVYWKGSKQRPEN